MASQHGPDDAIGARLVRAAAAARERAYAPYSRFAVGAAALFADGRIHDGCNVENASLGATRCAEQVAVLKGVSTGQRELIALAVVCDAPEPAWPCGVCRQVIGEFGQDATIYAANVAGVVRTDRLSSLQPHAFGPESLRAEGHDNSSS